MKAKRDEFVYTYRSTELAEFLEDTIKYSINEDGDNAANEFSAGASLTYGSFRFGMQLRMQDWSTYSSIRRNSNKGSLKSKLRWDIWCGISKCQDVTNQSNSTCLGFTKWV